VSAFAAVYLLVYFS